jgi:hypothetical protein
VNKGRRQKAEARSQEPGARSQKAGARRQKAGAGSQEPEWEILVAEGFSLAFQALSKPGITPPLGVSQERNSD